MSQMDVSLALDTTRLGRLQRLRGIGKSSRYLEIGVFKGDVFLHLDGLARKVAVDPKFRFERAALEGDGVHVFHEVPSDQYFAQLATAQDRFDLVYLDGLHTFEQTLRDFCAVITMMDDDAICLIDDTVPLNWAQAHPDQHVCIQMRPYCGDQSKKWMGDVFKVVYAIHDFFPQFSYATFPGHGQTVLWKQPRKDFRPFLNNLEKISRLDFTQFVASKDKILNFAETDAIWARIAEWRASVTRD